ncbi:hypothetical protein LTR36_007344 [Oleoguttula mirabilis]|uniref:Uncharacterized protein n=1 Tax=Oleoguttula mirabilis TaxID=1507867 RepID=A0AAV9J9L4_9PEZI|nr:hypothetical protein LTR36_007344 [Oleoguttula mirabilis]
MPLDFQIDQVKELVAEKVAACLSADEALLEAVRKRNQMVTFLLAIDCDVCNERPCELTLSGHQFDHVSDLFLDPSAPSLSLTVRVHLDFEEDANTVAGKTVEGLVRHAKRTYKGIMEYDPDAFDCVRLGDVTVPKPNPSSTKLSAQGDDDDGDTASNRGSGSSTHDAGEEYALRRNDALVGYFSRGDARTATNLQLLSVPSWDFGAFCIGDKNYHCTNIDFCKDHRWLPTYVGVRSLKVLCERIDDQLSRRLRLPGSGYSSELPFLPTFTLNTYHPALVFPAINFPPFPNQGIQVAVRFDHHLDLSDVSHKRLSNGKHKDIDFSMDEEIHVDAADNAAMIKEALLAALKKTKMSEGDAVTSGVLFEKPLLSKWELQLWVLPQSPKLVKLFRYPTGWRGSTGRLHEFLEMETVAEGDRRLYMEAHVVPK